MGVVLYCVPPLGLHRFSDVRASEETSKVVAFVSLEVEVDQDSSKGGAVETGCSDSYDVTY